MLANQQYTATSLMQFQLSLLCLGAALEEAAPVGSKNISAGIRLEAERLKEVAEARDR